MDFSFESQMRLSDVESYARAILWWVCIALSRKGMERNEKVETQADWL